MTLSVEERKFRDSLSLHELKAYMTKRRENRIQSKAQKANEKLEKQQVKVEAARIKQQQKHEQEAVKAAEKAAAEKAVAEKVAAEKAAAEKAVTRIAAWYRFKGRAWRLKKKSPPKEPTKRAIRKTLLIENLKKECLEEDRLKQLEIQIKLQEARIQQQLEHDTAALQIQS
jgi:colicin import membrane protein